MVLSATNSFEPVVKVTKVKSTTVSYDMTPAVSKEQLEKAVSGLITDASGTQTQTVSCGSGLDGKVGAVAYCAVDAGGTTVRRTVEVNKVDGLLIDFSVVPVLTKDEVAASLLDQLEQQLGERPDSATCTDDLEGNPGSTVDCTVVGGADTQDFTLTVTKVDGADINFRFESKK